MSPKPNELNPLFTSSIPDINPGDIPGHYIGDNIGSNSMPKYETPPPPPPKKP